MSPSKIILDLNKYPEITDVEDFIEWIETTILADRYSYSLYKDKYYLDVIVYYDTARNNLQFTLKLGDVKDIESDLSEDFKRELRELLRGI